MQKGNRMRLIDADALLEQMQPVSGFEVNNCAEALVMTIANAYIKLVEKQPTVQPDTNCSEFPNNSDTISRTQAIDAMESEIVSTNPEHFKSSEKFIKFMDDADIASFGKWQWANGFNTGVVATRIQLKKLPSAQPEIIRCKDCVNHIDDRCTVADHHVAPFSCCQSVFNAKNRGEQK